MPKAETFWCVKDPAEGFLLYSATKTKRYALQCWWAALHGDGNVPSYAIGSDPSWRSAQAMGSRLVKIQVREVKR